MVRSKNPSGRSKSKSGSGGAKKRLLWSSFGGLRTTHKNLCPLLSNPIAISFNCSAENKPRLPKHRNKTLRFGCESSHVRHSGMSPPRRSSAAINGPIQKIGGVGLCGSQSPSEIAFKALASSTSNVFTMIPADLGKWKDMSRKNS